ncbi:MAG: VOC family protein [Halococcoides sp.]
MTDTEAGAEFVHLDAGGVRLELVSYDPSGADPGGDDLQDAGTTHLAVAVDDTAAVIDSLPENVETLSDPQTTASGTTLAFLRDPEGNLVELIEA